MQIINTWPEDIILALPEQVKTALIQHLIQPFQNNKEEAKDYWLEDKPLLIILDKKDQLTLINQPPHSLAILLEDTLQHKLDTVLETPEYTDVFIKGYQINLAIFSNAGEGVYCVMPIL